MLNSDMPFGRLSCLHLKKFFSGSLAETCETEAGYIGIVLFYQIVRS